MPYRGSHACPRCAIELDHRGVGRHCHRCDGLWLEESELRARWHLVADFVDVPAMTPRLDRQRRLSCPICSTAMDKVMLEAVDIDRCREHGIWFDRNELLRVISTAELLESERSLALRHEPLPLGMGLPLPAPARPAPFAGPHPDDGKREVELRRQVAVMSAEPQGFLTATLLAYALDDLADILERRRDRTEPASLRERARALRDQTFDE